MSWTRYPLSSASSASVRSSGASPAGPPGVRMRALARGPDLGREVAALLGAELWPVEGGLCSRREEKTMKEMVDRMKALNLEVHEDRERRREIKDLLQRLA